MSRRRTGWQESGVLNDQSSRTKPIKKCSRFIGTIFWRLVRVVQKAIYLPSQVHDPCFVFSPLSLTHQIFVPLQFCFLFSVHRLLHRRFISPSYQAGMSGQRYGRNASTMKRHVQQPTGCWAFFFLTEGYSSGENHSTSPHRASGTCSKSRA